MTPAEGAAPGGGGGFGETHLMLGCLPSIMGLGLLIAILLPGLGVNRFGPGGRLDAVYDAAAGQWPLTALALVLLFWPVISAFLSLFSGSVPSPPEAPSHAVPFPEDPLADAIQHLVDYIRQETGIQLHEEDIDLSVGDDRVVAAFFGSPAGSWELPEASEPEDVAMAVMEGVGDVRQLLVDLRLSRARDGLDDFRVQVGIHLAGDGWGPDEMRALAYDLEEDSGFGAPESGWPDVELVVTGTAGDEVRLRASLYSTREPADPQEVAAVIREGLSPNV